MMKHFAVFGSPVMHSLSPIIHQAFAEQVGVTLRYERILTPQGSLKEALQQFRAQNGYGANITVPLKEEAFALCKRHSSRALKAKAVNTLYWENDLLVGDNTDGEGLLRFLTTNLHLTLENKRILILGAGGTVRGILGPLLERQPQAIVIVNRTLDKASALADPRSLKAYTYQGLQETKEAPFDIVINATSSSLQEMLTPLDSQWIENTIAIDVAYHQAHETPFQRWAKSHGAKAAHDGIGMLVGQAALAFKCWYGIAPETESVIKMLREAQS